MGIYIIVWAAPWGEGSLDMIVQTVKTQISLHVCIIMELEEFVAENKKDWAQLFKVLLA